MSEKGLTVEGFIELLEFELKQENLDEVSKKIIKALLDAANRELKK